MKSATEMVRITEEAIASNDEFLTRCNGILQRMEDAMVKRAKNAIRSLTYVIESRTITLPMIDYITIMLLKSGYKVEGTVTNEDGPVYTFVIRW